MEWFHFTSRPPEYGKEVLIYSPGKKKFKIAELVLDGDDASEYWRLKYYEGHTGTASTYDYEYWSELEFSY